MVQMVLELMAAGLALTTLPATRSEIGDWSLWPLRHVGCGPGNLMHPMFQDCNDDIDANPTGRAHLRWNCRKRLVLEGPRLLVKHVGYKRAPNLI